MESLKDKRIRAGKLGGKNKKGKKSAKTIDKEASLERIRQRVYEMSDKLINAQAIVALGTWKMVRPYIGEDGMPHTETIRNMDDMQKLIDTGVHGKDYLIVVGAEPDHKAAANLLDRSYGKPVESIEHSGRDGKPLIIRLDE